VATEDPPPDLKGIVPPNCGTAKTYSLIPFIIFNFPFLILIFILIFILLTFINPLPSGTLATFFLTAVGPIQHTNEDDIGREKTILMTSLRLERAAAVRRQQV
jgi:hypothetical protein